MGDYKDEKRALAETAPPTRLDLGVFNEQSTSLVNNQSLDDDDHPPPYPGVVPVRPPPPSNRRSQPVQTRCFQFKQKYLTTKNLAFAGGVLLGICALIVLYNIFLADDETKYLAYDKVSLGYFRNHNQKISFDETNNLILLSRQLGQHIDVERFALDQKREGFIHDQTELERGLRNCEQLADDVMCCDKTGAHAGAHCVLTQQDGTQVESLAKFHHNFSNNWQSLEDGHKLLPVGNKHGFTILDLKSNIMRKIERRMVPKTYKPVAYFFSMDTYEELAELAKSHDKFHICDYVPDTQHMYLLEDRCRETNMTVKPEFPLVKFCDNPLYSAVLQYGNRENDDDMEWVLQVKSAEIEQPYYASGRETAPLHQVTINCREDAIDFYIPGRSELYHYSVMLPNEMLD
ncbi:hypothetical protein L596_010593 [Steinernema carpocapsae]|uniref:Uncharacterized protein n=1 Tax=Steinernema carpocapsae TaxID=34508 RepID=A0A4U5PJA6_STECR|nr:hypothetical protein L596_010593 [Steinernema carpocapsae]